MTDTSDLGILADLAAAAGLLDADGQFRTGWLSDPGDHLSRVLSDDDQRAALLRFVDDALGGSTLAVDSRGRTWLPVFERPPDIALFAVVDDTAPDQVAIGLGVELSTLAPRSSTRVQVPLFRVGRDGPIGNPVHIGRPGARIDGAVQVDLIPDPDPDALSLGGIELGLDVPTSGADPIGAGGSLALLQLRLPGGGEPADLRLSLADAGQLDDVLIDLLLGLVGHTAGSTPTASAVARLLGLDTGDAIAPFPAAELAADGVAAVARWFEGVLAGAAARADWLQAAADLLGPGATATGDEIRLTLGPALVVVQPVLTTDDGGRSEVTVRARLALGAGTDAEATLMADLIRISLGSSGVVGLPALAAVGQVGRVAGGTRLLTGDPGVGALRVGLAVDDLRQVRFVLAADDVTVAGTQFPTLDLTNPDAVIAAAGQALGQIVSQLLAGLGPVGPLVAQLLGIDRPPASPTAPTIDLARLLHDPIGAERQHWLELVRNHPSVVAELLALVRDLIADDSVAGRPVSGTGTGADPWRIPIVDPVEIRVRRDPQAGVLQVGAGLSTRVDQLGQRCTVITADLDVALISVDLDRPSVDVLPSVDVVASFRGRGQTDTLIELGDLALIADRFELATSWRPAAGLSVALDAPGLRARLDGRETPLDLGSADGLQALAGILATASREPWLEGLAGAVGWVGLGDGLDDGPAGPVLSLSALLADPRAAVLDWLSRLAGATGTERGLSIALAGANILLGSITGSGRPDDPFLIPLGSPDGPAVTIRLDPDGPRPAATEAPDAIRAWRPGQPPPSLDVLTGALAAEADLDPLVAGFIDGRDELYDGLEHVISALTGTDGLVRPPAEPGPGGPTIHRLPDMAWSELNGRVDVAELLGTTPGTVLQVVLAEPDDLLQFDAVPVDRIIDLRPTGLPADAFPRPIAATGRWYVALSPIAHTERVARLQRVIEPFAAVAGDVAIVASGGAGHAALAAANQAAHVDAVITVGTPLAPQSNPALDGETAGETLRLLRTLLPALNAAAPDDPTLALGRALVAGSFPPPPLDPPVTRLVVVRPGLDHHAVFGEVGATSVRSALTAVIAARLAAVARARAGIEHRSTDRVRVGLSTPIRAAADDLSAEGTVAVDVAVIDVTGGGPIVSDAVGVHVDLSFRRSAGWLVDGDELQVRRVDARLHLPPAGAPAQSRIVLHEPTVYGVRRERWEVAGDGTGTPLLPEVRVALAAVGEQISTIGPVAQLLDGLGLVDGGGLDPGGLADLLHDPAGLVGRATADAAGRAELQAAADAVLPAGSPVTVDLAGRTLTAAVDGHLGSAPGRPAFVRWGATLNIGPGGAVAYELSVGGGETTPAAGLELRLASNPHRLTVVRHRPDGEHAIPLLPAGDVAALGPLVADVIVSGLVRIGLETLRDLDAQARPVADAVLDAVGLLAGDRVVVPIGLASDPAAWLAHTAALGGGAGCDPAKVAALVDALRPVLGLGGPPGGWDLAPGVTLRVGSAAGRCRLQLAVDTSALTPIAGAPGRLGATIAAGLVLDDGGPRPEVTAAVTAVGTTGFRLEAGAGLRLALTRTGRADLPLHPDFPGLGDLLAAGVEFVLPVVLDDLAARTGPGLDGQAGAVVRAVGDGLRLRPAGSFDQARLRAVAADPGEELLAGLAALTGPGVAALAAALDGIVPAGLTVAEAAGQVTVTASTVTVSVRPAPFSLGIAVQASGLAGVGAVSATLAADGAQVTDATLTVGPASVDLAGVEVQPVAVVAIGAGPPGGRRVDLGLATAGGTDRLLARWDLERGQVGVAVDRGGAVSTDPDDVALAVLALVLEVAAGVALDTAEVQSLLATPVGQSTVQALLSGVLLDPADPTRLVDLFGPTTALDRLRRLVANLADAQPSVDVEGLVVGVDRQAGRVGITLAPAGRVDLITGEIVVSIEADSRWIVGGPAPGLFLGLVAAAPPNDLSPALACNGIGLRVWRPSAPLLDEVVTLDSVAVHFFAAVGAPAGGVGPPEVSGGAQVQLSGLAVAAGGASGGNPVAQGLVSETGGDGGLAPAFSPALAVQRHAGDDTIVSLSAGEGAGPWWLSIQSGFGPLYIEQVGLGVTVRQNDLEKISLLLDGRVSVFGLTAAVDDLSLTYSVASSTSILDPSRWDVDLAGLAIDADLGGVVLAGGLRKLDTPTSVEYLGMLMGRFSVYGLAVFGGYAETEIGGRRVTSFFAFGAVNGPIGGPPAFFITGIGGGIGINRSLELPTDLSRFGEYPLIRALDPAAGPSQNPMADLEALREVFPVAAGQFWFAAGISFNSFALVDGVAVVSVAIGDGLEIALLGLARMALPRPELALVSIELGLVARFSTAEGVLWIQAQLTDNSWLLHESVRLTGGFAFVTWFGGPHAGEFVLTMGGYHPAFRRAHFPQVPRLGYAWSVSDFISIKGENYFALCSEAVMAGGRFEASARFGPAWARVVFGADGIVYFDPFRFRVDVYASISAGITIDVWIGKITIKIHLGAHVTVEGPRFRGRATFEVGPIDITVAFGSSQQSERRYLPWGEFVAKYLEDAGDGTARVVTSIPGVGALPPGPAADGSDRPVADGSPARPFEVLAEFELTVTTTVPTERFHYGDGPSEQIRPDRVLGVAPVNAARLISELRLRLVAVDIERPPGADPADDPDWITMLDPRAAIGGRFPVGVWGPPGEEDAKTVPEGDVIAAADTVHLRSEATLRDELPTEVPYHRIEINRTDPRHPLPLKSAELDRSRFFAEASDLAGIVPTQLDADQQFALAERWLAGAASGTTVAAYRGERRAVPILGALAETFAPAPLDEPGTLRFQPPPVPGPDLTVAPPYAVGLIGGSGIREQPVLRTTVTGDERIGARPVDPPTLADVVGATDGAVPARVLQPLTSLPGAIGRVGLTRSHPGATASVAGLGRSADDGRRLRHVTGSLSAGRPTAARTGEVLVLELPNAERDLDTDAPRPSLACQGAPGRFVALGFGGTVLADTFTGVGNAPAETAMPIPIGASRLVVVNTGGGSDRDLLGWHAGQRVPYVGLGAALAAGAVVRVPGGGASPNRQRRRAGWVELAELVADGAVVETRFDRPIRTVAVALDRIDGAGEPTVDLRLAGASTVGPVDGVVAGTRTYLCYSVIPDDGATSVTVAVGRQAGWAVGAVLGAENDVREVVAGGLQRHGPDALLQPLVAGRADPALRQLTVRWQEPTNGSGR